MERRKRDESPRGGGKFDDEEGEDEAVDNNDWVGACSCAPRDLKYDDESRD